MSELARNSEMRKANHSRQSAPTSARLPRIAPLLKNQNLERTTQSSLFFSPRLPLYRATLTRMAPSTSTSFKKRVEGTSRRVRVLFNKKIVADSKEAKFVWEHPYYPVYYLPEKDVQTKYIKKVNKSEDGEGHVCRLTVGDRSAEKVLWVESGELSGLIKFQFNEMGTSPAIRTFADWEIHGSKRIPRSLSTRKIRTSESTSSPRHDTSSSKSTTP
jgi:uncharacterized protein (DUF427 family)